MIKIYNRIDLLGDKVLIKSMDAAFNADIIGAMLDVDDLSVMQEIDKAELLDMKLGSIKVPYGVCSLRNLSTGCKIVIYARYMIREGDTRVLNASECGKNAFNLLCKYVDDSNLLIYTNQCDCVEISNNYDFLLNNEIRTNELFRKWG